MNYDESNNLKPLSARKFCISSQSFVCKHVDALCRMKHLAIGLNLVASQLGI